MNDVPLGRRQLDQVRRAIRQSWYVMGFMALGAVLPGYRIGRDTSYSTKETVAMGSLAGAACGATLPLIASVVILLFTTSPGQVLQMTVGATIATGTAFVLGGVAGTIGAYVGHRRHGNGDSPTQSPTVVDSTNTDPDWRR